MKNAREANNYLEEHESWEYFVIMHLLKKKDHKSVCALCIIEEREMRTLQIVIYHVGFLEHHCYSSWTSISSVYSATDSDY